jgi:hypothetical protein
MSRAAGSWCFFLQKKSIMSTSLSLWRCMSKVQNMILPKKTWMFYVMWSWFWGCHVYCHCLSVSISSSRLCKAEMYLYAILWRLSSWANLNYISCIVIFLPSLRMLPLMFQCNWKLDKCNNVDAMVLWLKWGRGCIIPCILFFGKRYLIYNSCIEGVIVPQPIIKVVFGMAVNKVKEECEGATWWLISKLEMQIPE